MQARKDIEQPVVVVAALRRRQEGDPFIMSLNLHRKRSERLEKSSGTKGNRGEVVHELPKQAVISGKDGAVIREKICPSQAGQSGRRNAAKRFIPKVICRR